DVAAESMGLILTCWERLDPERRGLTSAEVINLLYKNPPTDRPEFHADLREALESLLGEPDARALGTRLRSFRRRVFQLRFIDQVGKHPRAPRWAVYPASEFHRQPQDTHHTHHTHPARDGFGECGECSECISAAAANAEVKPGATLAMDCPDGHGDAWEGEN